MGATMVLSETNLAVEPGESTSFEVRLRNTGEVVDQFRMDVVGDAAGWTTVEPALINLLPGDEASAQVTFSPPRTSDVPASVIPFGVRALSREDPYASSVEQGEIEVRPFTELAAELVPVTRRAKRRGKYVLAVDNTGNHSQRISVAGIDLEDRLDVVPAESTLDTEPGTANLIKVSVAPHRRFWRGDEKTLPFQLLVQPADDADDPTDQYADDIFEPLTVDGVLIQGPLQPRWLLKALVGAVVALVALVAAWFTLFKPTIESVAREQAEEKAAAASKRADQAADRANEAAERADPGGGAGGDSAAPGSGGTEPGADGQPNGAVGDQGTGAGTGGAAGGVTAATSFRIQADAPPVTDGSFTPFSYTAPRTQQVQIADLVLQNPRGDSGFVRIALDGEVVLEVGLANFRDLDYHYVVPLTLQPRRTLQVQVNCEEPGSSARRCSPAVSFSGRLVAPERR